MLTKILSKEACNNGRQPELDIARGLAVFFMVLIHVQEYFSNATLLDSNFATFIDFLGSPPAAPVFMLLLGAGIVYTKKSDPSIFIKRGFILILQAYILNAIRATLPYLLESKISNNADWYVPLAFDALIYIDILPFAGLCMIMFGIFKKNNTKLSSMIVVAAIFAFSNYFLVNIKTENYFLKALSGLVWGSSNVSFFPFLTWVFYPIAGYIFASFLIRVVNKNRFYLFTFLASLAILLISLSLCYYFEIDFGLGSNYSYYHHQVIGNIIFTSFALCWISILFFVSKKIPKIIYKNVARWSKNVTEIYFIHWVIIGWMVILVGFNTLGFAHYIILSTIVYIVSDVFAEFYKAKKIKST